ncbi:UDP-glucose:glycoprotein glucosyltransferase 1 isoform X2 [Mixophyes fleayi]|uniref:UDP-glucose:glycoprotein glucosyltransferase 1 isoform X2 n=1 Tax=Mixophyes fleayi TaxID=3061075 RepID=UPI003F4E1EAB
MEALPLLLVLCLCFSSANAVDSKAVTMSLNTKWLFTPLLLEASEFLADEGPDKFWTFVDENQQVADQGSDSANYNLLLSNAGRHLSPVQQNLLKFALSLRSYSATVQTFQQIALDEPPPGSCAAFIVVHGEKTCHLDRLPSLLRTAPERSKPFLFKGDHQYPGTSHVSPVVILYAEIGSEDFSRFHQILSARAREGEFSYVLRHYVQNPRKEKVYLSGYGVELAIKSTEYKAKDDTQVKDDVNATAMGYSDPEDEVQGFLFGRLRQIYPELKEELKELRKHLVESTNEMSPLKVWELQDLSYQTASRILAAPSSEALMVLKDLSQNFPTKARALTRTVVDSAMRQEVQENQKYFKGTLGLQPGDSALFINGLHIDLDNQDIFSLFDVLRNEARVMEGLHRLGIEGEALHNVLKINTQFSTSDYAVDIRTSAISWVNNLEIDSRYSSWPSSVQELLRPTFPGVIRQIRKNLHNFVLFIDPVQESTSELINMVEMFLSNNIPMRIGIVFVVNDAEDVDGFEDAGVALLRTYNYVSDEEDNYHAFQTIISIYNKIRAGEKLSVKHVTSVLEEKYRYVEPSSILGRDSAYDQYRKEGKEYFLQTGLPPLPVVLFNGIPFPKDQLVPDELETAAMHKILESTTFFQKAVYLGELTNEQDVVDFIMTQPNVIPRINLRILETDRQYLDLTATNNYFVDDYARFSVLDTSAKSAAIANSMNYLSKKGDLFIRPVTFWIVADFDKPSGRQLLYDAIKHQKTSNYVRLGMINNPSEDPSSEGTRIGRAIWAALQTQSSNNAKNFITKIIKEENARAVEAGQDITEFAVGGMDVDLFREAFDSPKVDFILSHAAYCRDVLKLKKGEQLIIGNGRIVGPLKDSEVFNQNDFHLLERLILKSSAQKIKSHILELEVEDDHASDLVMRVDSLLSSQPRGEGRTEYQLTEDQHSVIKVRPKEGMMYYEVVAIVDPVTKAAQKLAPLLLVFNQIINMNLRVFMNCQSKLSEMPLKSFYRYVLEPEIVFASDHRIAIGPIAKFLDMPQSPLFTLNVNTPDSWMVQSVWTPYDLDNIYLEEVDSIVAAEFELEYLLLEGHCFDVSTGQPPRGLQFTLGTVRNPVVVDTIVMANLGYFQLKAKPGAWLLRLRNGRSEEIYNIYSHDGTDSAPEDKEVVVVLNDFRSKTIKVKVQKKADKMTEDLLSEGTNENESGFWESITWGLSGGQKQEAVKQEKEDVLNIFSLASGHLYERFLRIMMLTVLKNTKTPVKFWFLKNYLSPTFKNFIPYMAKKYNFQYELVQYKWPRWLHQQTEKQRIIWGYKILFLDVLFPLAVDKILYVDADQIVRTDLKELRDLNLDGAPYGYTPFCESRREMDGYRFWRSGYWASHLAGRKYHISALYVVDLKKFRKIAAGDRLRGQYQGLSQDPNSLSNLDQDLPNNMIHQVPIKSLPQEWLWCETWCDDASKKRAKTIDLCNNPMTKEPKLEAAVRIIPEWQEYDQEIKRLYNTFLEEFSSASVDLPGDIRQPGAQDHKSHVEL